VGHAQDPGIKAAHQDDGGRAIGIRQRVQQFDTIAAGHLQVQEHHTRGLLDQ